MRRSSRGQRIVFRLPPYDTPRAARYNKAKFRVHRRHTAGGVCEQRITALRKYRYRLQVKVLHKQDSVQCLRATVDKQLSWKSHIANVQRICLGKIASIWRSSVYLPKQVRKMLYLSFLIPHLGYCSVVWHNCGVVLTSRVECIQNYALSVILKKPSRSDTRRCAAN